MHIWVSLFIFLTSVKLCGRSVQSHRFAKACQQHYHRYVTFDWPSAERGHQEILFIERAC